MIRVVIADDIQILRRGLRAIMSQDKELEVVGLAGRREGGLGGLQETEAGCGPHGYEDAGI